jgi:membrane protease YdiL (CAAX protease family)
MNQNANLSQSQPKAIAELPPPWGFWATLAWAVLAVLAAGVTGGAILWFDWGQVSPSAELQDQPWFLLQLIMINAAQVGVAAAAARLADWPVGPYLGLNRPRGRDVLIGIAALIILLLLLEGLTYLLGRAHVSPFQVDSYRAARTAGMLPLLWLAFVVVIPACEEIAFRGFLFRGWAASPLGVPGTIILTSLIFAVAHTQYDWFGAFQTFCMGMLFGILRWRSGSTTLTIILHMLINFVATAWTALKAAGAV